MYLLCVYVLFWQEVRTHLYDVQFSNYIISTLSFYGSFWLLLVFFHVQFISLTPSLRISLSMPLLSGTHVVCVNVGCCKSLDLIWNYTQVRQFFATIFSVVTKKAIPLAFGIGMLFTRMCSVFTCSHALDPPPACVCEANENFQCSNTFPMLMENRKYAYKRMVEFMWMCSTHRRITLNMRKAACWKCILCHLAHELHERKSKSKFNIPLCVYKRFEHKFIHLLEHYAVYIAATATTPLENN